MMVEEDISTANISCAGDHASPSHSPVHEDGLCSLSENNLSKISALYEKYNIQCAEIERIEKQNSEYRDQLLKTIHERDAAQESFRTCKSEKSSKLDEVERKVLELEYQLKVCKDRSAAQETYHVKVLNETTARLNSTITQLTKKCDFAEREKNDAVVRYATREADLMHLKTELDNVQSQNAALTMERDALIQSTGYELQQEYKEAIETVRKELESGKVLRAQQEEALAVMAKRYEAVQTVTTELRSMLEQSQRQLARETEDRLNVRNEHDKLLQQMDSDGKSREAKESIYKKVFDELGRLRGENDSMRSDLRSTSDKLNETTTELETERRLLESASHELDSLRDINTQVDRYKASAERAERTAEEATEERNQAEEEAGECRKQTERMLAITEKLTDKNSQLSSECDSLRTKNTDTCTKLIEVGAELRRTKERTDENSKQLDCLKVTTTAEITSLKQELNAKIVKVQELTRLLDETRNEKEVLKKKNTSNVKELRAEVQSLRKAQTSARVEVVAAHESNEPSLFLPIMNGTSSSSRASSICSMETGTGTGTRPAPPVQTTTSLDNDIPPSQAQCQKMVEKIVKLQRQLARKQDKVEFLEEHVRQCIEELRNKTKIIQNYALREEASLLLPEGDSLSQVPLARRKAATTLMGTIFGSSSGKSELELATEVNSRLQAVLEDTLYKNITLKNNVDTLGEEISRLSRENRHMALSNAT